MILYYCTIIMYWKLFLTKFYTTHNIIIVDLKKIIINKSIFQEHFKIHNATNHYCTYLNNILI